MTEVPRVSTKPTTGEWRAALLDAAELLGITLDDDALSVLWAQWALETRRGDCCFNFNLGNIKWSGEGDWMWLDTFEYIAGRRVDMRDKFRAFATLGDGALDYLRFLCRPSYALPWAHVVVGDADGFARALRVKGYYTASVDDYAGGLRSLALEFRHALGEQAADPTARQGPVADADDGTAATPIRAGEGEHESDTGS